MNGPQPRRNDPCWCGPGKKYKRCHLQRASESPLPPQAVLAKSLPMWDRKKCLHPDAGPGRCSKVIDAHTVARSGTLRAILDDENRVCRLSHDQKNPLKGVVLATVGWRDASTIGGFCGRHDADAFGSIDRQPFEPTSETCFRLAYRAVCFEYYQKLAHEAALEVQKPLIDRGLQPSAQRRAQKELTWSIEAVAAGARDMRVLKKESDASLVARRWHDVRSIVLRFAGPQCVACCGGPSPTFDLSGAVLQRLEVLDREIEGVFWNTIATAEGPAVVLGWQAGKPAGERFARSVLDLPPDVLPSALVQAQFALSENTFFSREWWESLPDGARGHLIRLAADVDPTHDALDLRISNLVPWSLQGVHEA